MNPKICKISGPPGCGKTSYLLKQIENSCRKYEPERIGAVSFSKAAVQEMRDRVTTVLGLRGKATSNIRTIHSHCYQLLHIEKSMVVEEKGSLIREWNEKYPGYSLPSRKEEENLEDLPSLRQDYQLFNNVHRFNRMQILRNRLIPMEDWKDEEAKNLWSKWFPWLQENGYFDFTLMLEEVFRRRLCPDISVLFIDEAQDLSSLQISVTRMWADQCDTAIWIGDQDQALYRFSGAVPEDFRDLPHDWSNILDHSYRVPRSVHDYALKLISQIGPRREQIDYHPREADGLIEDNNFFPDLSLPGTHMILCRCNFQLTKWIKWMISQGAHWHNPYRPNSGWNPTSTKLWKAATVYDQLASGLDVPAKNLNDLIAEIKVKGNLVNGIKTSRKKVIDSSGIPVFNVFNLSSLGWFEADFFNFNKNLNEIFSLQGNAGDLLAKTGRTLVQKDPKVIIGTIHSIKGGEADHVWIDLSSTAVIHRSYLESVVSRDDEIRVAYVAVTRARESCHLLQGGFLRNMAFLPL